MTGGALIPITRSSITPALSSTSMGRATRVPLGKIKSKIKNWKPSIVLRQLRGLIAGKRHNEKKKGHGPSTSYASIVK